MRKRIFVSHAAKDKLLADALVDLLQTGTNVSHDDIFCSSLEGLGIPAGQNFIEYIKSQLQQPDIVVALVSRNYFESQFCLCELGATWAMSHVLLPLLVPPLTYDDIGGVITSIQVNNIDTAEGLNSFATELKKHLGGSMINLSRWDVKKKRFVQSLGRITAKLPIPESVSRQEHDTLLERFRECQEALDQNELETSRLRDMVAALKACKDSEEVKDVEKSFSTSYEVFVGLVDAVKSAFSKLPRIVTFVAYQEGISDDGVLLDRWDESALKEATDAYEHQYLLCDEPTFALNADHPKVRRAAEALRKLSEFIWKKQEEYEEKDEDDSLFELFEQENDYPLSLANRDFWHDYINDAITVFGTGIRK